MIFDLAMTFQVKHQNHTSLKKKNQLDFIKIKNNYVKDTVNRIKAQATDWKKIVE